MNSYFQYETYTYLLIFIATKSYQKENKHIIEQGEKKTCPSFVYKVDKI